MGGTCHTLTCGCTEEDGGSGEDGMHGLPADQRSRWNEWLEQRIVVGAKTVSGGRV